VIFRYGLFSFADMQCCCECVIFAVCFVQQNMFIMSHAYATLWSQFCFLDYRSNRLSCGGASVTVNSYNFGSLLTYLCIHSYVLRTDSDQLLVSSVLRASRYIFWSPRTRASQATDGAVAWWLNSHAFPCRVCCEAPGLTS